jgi:Zn ribbon nucleic-acid-binding protein
MRLLAGLIALMGFASAVTAADYTPRPITPPPSDKGFLADPNIFPIAVWVQNPARAAEYKTIGINLYVGLWRGPTEAQLAELKRNGMRLICSQNDVGLKHLDDPTIVAWMHGDEPDNARSLGKGKGYGPPVTPAKVVQDYERIKKADPSRPVFLNLGQGVAWDKYVGRGTRTNHPEDYPEYVKGCDIASFDIYPAVHDHSDVTGKLWFVADGVSRLRKWTEDRKPVWNCIECTHISNPNAKATPKQVKAEVWMSLVRGSRGLIYFVHQFRPNFIEAGLLADKEMAAAVRAINKQIQELAPVLNSPTVPDGVTVVSSVAAVPVDAITKRRDDATYVFAVAMRDGTTTATFTVTGLTGRAKAEVLGENRTVELGDGVFKDEFEAWDVHLYRIRGR